MPQRPLVSNKMLQYLTEIVFAARLGTARTQRTWRVAPRENLRHRSCLAVSEATAADDQIAQPAEQAVIDVRSASG